MVIVDIFTFFIKICKQIIVVAIIIGLFDLSFNFFE